MRAILAGAILLLGLSGAREPEHSALLRGSFAPGGGMAFASLVEIESSRARGDRDTIATPALPNIGKQGPAPVAPQPAAAPSTQAAPAPAANGSTSTNALPNAGEANAAPAVPLEQLCSALLTSAQDNDLPVAFFANLIWQESRLRDNAVSPKGALGIAQFMPKVAVASGLQNPFDPLQALAASARLLRSLRDQFGNLGLVAAAYNAGAKRVSEWLQRGRTLPRETRGYVMNITGHSVEQWQKTPLAGDALPFVRRLPCRDQPAFAEIEQARQQQAKLQQQDSGQGKPAAPQPQETKAVAKLKPEEIARADHSEQRRGGEPEHLRVARKHETMRIAERDHRRHEAKLHVHRVGHERRRRV